MVRTIGGAQTFIKAAFEDKDVWGQDADSMTESNATEFAFGQGIDSAVSRTNNKQRIHGTGARNAASTIALQYGGTLTVNGALSNVYWLLGVLGSVSDGGSGPSSYTHTYTESDTLPSFTTWRRSSFDTATNEVFQGCVVNSCTLTAAVNEPVRFTLECPYRYDKLDTDAESAVTDTQKIYTFAGGVIEVPNGTTIAKVQNFELTINNDVELVYEVGSRFASDFIAKVREYNFSMTVAIEDFDLLGYFYNGSTGTAPGTGAGELADIQLTFTNGDSHSIVFTLTGVHFNEDSLNHDVGAVVQEEITGWANALTNVVYTNATENAPAEATNV